MDENKETVELQEKKDFYADDTETENEYKVYDYFKEHTGLLIACVSAIVATMSFVLRFAIGRMNYAYLDYWDIAAFYANTGNQNEMHLVISSLLFILALMSIHWLLRGTADAFTYYIELLSAINQKIREDKKYKKQTEEILERMSCKINCMTPEQENDPNMGEITATFDKSKKELEKSVNELQRSKKRKRTLIRMVLFHVVLVIILSYIIGSLFIVLIGTTGSLRESFRLSYPVIAAIIFYLLRYFLLPVFIGFINKRKQRKNENASQKIKGLLDKGFPDFPFDKIFINGIKPFFTDRKLCAAVIQTGIIAVMLMCSMAFYGNANAKHKLSFPIYTDGETIYAIVYISGSTKFMEEATIHDGSILIDTTKQRILTSEDIYYSIEVFDDVSVIRIEDEQKFIQPTFYVKNFANSIGTFFETRKEWIELLVQNENSMSASDSESELSS